MIYNIILGILMFIGFGLSVVNIIFAIKAKKQNSMSAEELEAFTAENGTSNKGESMDEVEVLTFYSPKDLGLY